MIDHVLRFTVPAGYGLLPPEMASPKATAMLLAIGLQESRFLERRQRGGPARGFWQFEQAGVRGVLKHHATQALATAVLRTLRYAVLPATAHHAVEHNDTLAFVLARLLLWTLPSALPTRDEPVLAWAQYMAAWRPGKPHHETWNDCYAEAWDRVELTR